MPFASIEAAVEDIRAGKMVIVVDDDDRENEGDLIFAAEHVTPDKINFLASHGKGLICIPLDAEYFERLNIPMMVPEGSNSSKFATNFGIGLSAKDGITTGISAFDRSHSVKVLIDPKTTAEELSMPGHIFPLKARSGGVLERRGHTESAVDLARMAGCLPAGVLCEIMDDDGTMARLPALEKFAKKHQLKMITVADIAAYRRHNETFIERVEETTIPTRYGDLKTIAYRDPKGLEHLALCLGEFLQEDCLVRMHSECLTGDVFGSLRCDCGQQLNLALERMQKNGSGILLYLRQEGRGIGLANKIKAYALQDRGMDTVEANRELGFPDDARTYNVGAAILKDLGVKSVSIMTNNPNKMDELKACGIKVIKRIAHRAETHEANDRYLKAKAQKLGHLLSN